MPEWIVNGVERASDRRDVQLGGRVSWAATSSLLSLTHLETKQQWENAWEGRRNGQHTPMASKKMLFCAAHARV